MSENEKREDAVRACVSGCTHISPAWTLKGACWHCIAAALDAAEARGRQEERALSEQHWNSGYKSGERIGREKGLEMALGVAEQVAVGLPGPEASALIAACIRALQRGAAGEEKG